MAYLYKVYIVIEDEPENLFHQNLVDKALTKALDNNSTICFVGSEICELGASNCGRCCKCGAWVSDSDDDDVIEGFSNGCNVGGEWLCDLCLPEDHPKKF